MYGEIVPIFADWDRGVEFQAKDHERRGRKVSAPRRKSALEGKNEEAIMAIATSVQDCLVREGVHYDMIAHERTRDSNHTAQAAHIPGGRLAKCVMLEDDKGYLMAVRARVRHRLYS